MNWFVWKPIQRDTDCIEKKLGKLKKSFLCYVSRIIVTATVFPMYIVLPLGIDYRNMWLLSWRNWLISIRSLFRCRKVITSSSSFSTCRPLINRWCHIHRWHRHWTSFTWLSSFSSKCYSTSTDTLLWYTSIQYWSIQRMFRWRMSCSTWSCSTETTSRESSWSS